ncbi:MAG: hypothetical protein Q4P66_04560 [Actinomycetaceae bacterium]|nr:hypothetical protein [Actinomycetaceae bacterium]
MTVKRTIDAQNAYLLPPNDGMSYPRKISSSGKAWTKKAVRNTAAIITHTGLCVTTVVTVTLWLKCAKAIVSPLMIAAIMKKERTHTVIVLFHPSPSNA